MRPEDIRDLLKAQPFRPVRFTLTDGTSYDVRHPELVNVGRSTVFLGIPNAEEKEPIFDNFRIISLLHIMQAQPVDTAKS
jgi:hypothetical protein